MSWTAVTKQTTTLRSCHYTTRRLYAKAVSNNSSETNAAKVQQAESAPSTAMAPTAAKMPETIVPILTERVLPPKYERTTLLQSLVKKVKGIFDKEHNAKHRQYLYVLASRLFLLAVNSKLTMHYSL